jgi:hypothetical protein
MNKVLSLLFLQFLFFGSNVSAQTVSPIIVECSKKCRGEFSITNNGLTPLAVTLEARSFSLDTLGNESRPRLRSRPQAGRRQRAHLPERHAHFCLPVEVRGPSLLRRAALFDGRGAHPGGDIGPRPTRAHHLRL